MKRYKNGTINWGTEGNKPRLFPVEYYQTFEEIVRDAGYLFDQYQVKTEDGYILTVYRIRHKEYTDKDAPVVFFQHGLLSCATTWIIHYPELAPAFQMVRHGYDVWLGNNRGTTFSRQHATMNPDRDSRYWAYSFQDLGDFDTEAQIDMVLHESGRQNLTYIGHSQGTTQMFYALSTNYDQWKDKINLFVAIAPIVYMSNTDAQLLKLVAKLDSSLGWLMRRFGKYEMMPINK